MFSWRVVGVPVEALGALMDVLGGDVRSKTVGGDGCFLDVDIIKAKGNVQKGQNGSECV